MQFPSAFAFALEMAVILVGSIYLFGAIVLAEGVARQYGSCRIALAGLIMGVLGGFHLEDEFAVTALFMFLGGARVGAQVGMMLATMAFSPLAIVFTFDNHDLH